MVEHVNRSARDGQRTHRAARARRAVRSETRARPEFDLCIDVTKLPLSIANCCVGGYLGLAQPHHLRWPLVLYSGAIERECVAVAAIGVGSILAQPWQRSPQFTASLL
jgi:hypothetical protein